MAALQGTLIYHIPDSSFNIKEYCIFRQHQSPGVGEYYKKDIAFGLGREISIDFPPSSIGAALWDKEDIMRQWKTNFGFFFFFLNKESG